MTGRWVSLSDSRWWYTPGGLSHRARAAARGCRGVAYSWSPPARACPAASRGLWPPSRPNWNSYSISSFYRKQIRIIRIIISRIIFLPACGATYNLRKLSVNFPWIFFRIQRMKLDKGGDGVSHHRSTSDGGRHDKRACQCRLCQTLDSACGITLHCPISFVSFLLRFTTQAAEPSAC